MPTICKKCGQPRELGAKCRECSRAYNREYRRLHPELRDRHRAYYAANKEHFCSMARRWKEQNAERVADCLYLRLYGITKARRDAMIAEQQGRCALCDQKPLSTLHIDHDHQTGRVRRMLCRRCNHLLGTIEKNRNLVDRMFTYIREYKETQS